MGESVMVRPWLVLSAIAVWAAVASGQAGVQVEPTTFHGPRPLAKQTESAVVRDYLEAWQSMGAALGGNRVDLLDQDFVGAARDKLAQTIAAQVRQGISTRYVERSHDIQIIFYSPEGLSIQVADNVDYDLQLVDHDKVLATEPIHARAIAVLTPTEVRWKVRVLQAGPR
jgi:hypothetical protein